MKHSYELLTRQPLNKRSFHINSGCILSIIASTELEAVFYVSPRAGKATFIFKISSHTVPFSVMSSRFHHFRAVTGL